MFVAVAAGIYYAVVGLVFYRREAKDILSGNIKLPKRKKSSGQEIDEFNDEEDRAFEELELVISDLKESVFDRAGAMADRYQLLKELKERLASYDGLRRPAYQHALNHYVMEQAKEKCGVVYSEEELDDAWSTLPR